MSSLEIEGGKNGQKNSRSGETTEQNSSAEWLPSGWAAEVRVRKNGKKDMCYIDLSNGLKFLSKPEVFRYLNNMETKRAKYMRERKGKGIGRLSAIMSPAVSGQLNFADSGANEPMTKNQSSNVVGVMKDNENLEIHTGGDEREKSDQSVVVVPLSARVAENGMESPGKKLLQHQVSEKNKRKKTDLPRRTSKRLAGIEAGPITELKTNNRTHRVSSKRLDAAEASKSENFLDLATPEECVEKKEAASNRLEASKSENFLDLATPEECVEKKEAVDNGENKKAEEREGSPLNFSLKDLWTDPCIEFAIKTLMDAIPIEVENQAEQNPGPSVELPFGDSWGDPCIDFAVKTLTGAIPVVEDFGIPDCLLTSSSETKQDKGLEISISGLHNSGDSGIHPHCQEGSDQHHRKKVHW